MYHSNVCFPILRSPVTHPKDVPEVLAYPIRGCFPPPSNAVLFFLYHDSFLVPFRAAACLTDQTAAASAVYLNTVLISLLNCFVIIIAAFQSVFGGIHSLVQTQAAVRADKLPLFFTPAAPQAEHSVLIPFPKTSTALTECSLHLSNSRLLTYPFCHCVNLLFHCFDWVTGIFLGSLGKYMTFGLSVLKNRFSSWLIYPCNAASFCFSLPRISFCLDSPVCSGCKGGPVPSPSRLFLYSTCQILGRMPFPLKW